jgi:hypothetical protein
MNKNDNKAHMQTYKRTHTQTRSDKVTRQSALVKYGTCTNVTLFPPLSLARSIACLSLSLSLALTPSLPLSLPRGLGKRESDRERRDNETKRSCPPPLSILSSSLSLSARKRTHTCSLYPVQAQTLWRVILAPTLAICPDISIHTQRE